MLQELAILRQSILNGQYVESIALIDELDEMSKKAILSNIQSYLIRLMTHLVKNQLEQRLTNSWAASVHDSVLRMQKLNLQDNKNSYYIKNEGWAELIDESFETAIFEASTEVFGGIYKPREVRQRVNRAEVVATTYVFLNLTYSYSSKLLSEAIEIQFTQLPGGEAWGEPAP
jgi:hypothetical protein